MPGQSGNPSGRIKSANSIIRDAAKAVLSKQVKSKSGETYDALTGILLAQVNKALKGDTRAAELILKCRGWAPTTEVTGPGGLPVGLTMKDWVDECTREKEGELAGD